MGWEFYVIPTPSGKE